MKILLAIASYGTSNDRYLLQLVREYHSMSYDVDVVVLSNIPKEVAPGVEVIVVNLRGKNPWSLPFPHKRVFADRLNGYDLFIYSEDDTLIREGNIRAFLEVSAALPENEIAGFLRYEESPEKNRNYPDVHAHFHWDPGSVRSRGPYTLAFFTNQHSACYVMTQHQLRLAIQSGGFLATPQMGKYDLLCTAATGPYTQCGFEKLICISHLDDFLIHHLPNKYVGTKFGVDDHELRRQVQALLRIDHNGHHPASLFETESRLRECAYSKSYYEPVSPEVVSAVPQGARSVLSIGCGWGATEVYLAEKGLSVSAVPLDPVIPGGAEAGGVEIVNGDLASARQRLADRKFDCLLLSNVLHLVPNPVQVLSSYASLLSDDGAAIAVIPNMARLSATWKSLRDDANSAARGSYEKIGVHQVSQNLLRGWFRSARMKIEKILHVGPKRSTKLRRLASRLLDSWMADEFVVVATRESGIPAS
jgi:2-polyprenyl-3-methyl-5-hydroxy-6-metoxy-1,4-benzoquinol methylase